MVARIISAYKREQVRYAIIILQFFFVQNPISKIVLTSLNKILHELSYILHDPGSDMICLGFKIAFSINADDRLCI